MNKHLQDFKQVVTRRNIVKRSADTSHIIIGNHAAIVALCLYLRDEKFQDYAQSISLFKPPFWLDHVSKDHLKKLWGQTLSDYPREIRELFQEFVPSVVEDIDWETYLLFLGRCEAFLKASGVHFVELKKYPRLYYIRSTDLLKIFMDHQDTSKVKRLFNINENFHIYEWYRKPLSARVRISHPSFKIKFEDEAYEMLPAWGQYWPDIFEWSGKPFDTIFLFGKAKEVITLIEKSPTKLPRDILIYIILLDGKKDIPIPGDRSIRILRIMTMEEMKCEFSPKFSKHYSSDNLFLKSHDVKDALCLHAGQPPIFNPPPHTILYKKTISEVKELPSLIFGAGESAIWLYCHFYPTNQMKFISPYTKDDILDAFPSPMSPHYRKLGLKKKTLLLYFILMSSLKIFFELIVIQ